jgi:hypothetical protein
VANFFFQNGLADLLSGSLTGGSWKVALLITTVPDPDWYHPTSMTECSATGYTGGYGGSGRKATTVSFSADNTTNRTYMICTDCTWNPLGGATNQTVIGAVLIYEKGGADSSSVLVAWFDGVDTPTNGGTFTADFSATGDLFIQCG